MINHSNYAFHAVIENLISTVRKFHPDWADDDVKEYLDNNIDFALKMKKEWTDLTLFLETRNNEELRDLECLGFYSWQY